ncbi:hypothetical protein C7T94_10885 [Pedobacter yulinensis]|uniref:Uncharacterized protein n=1 Tax=Pedobacter yulinensis TaxID=2126353 RepID=A0A2T3HL17_9SPHI|nr:hypothetical protein [Pedobacter yulinensis]PST83109.1 hypothetical protein C7T94_10885 [Pedobacter yulinensis]
MRSIIEAGPRRPSNADFSALIFTTQEVKGLAIPDIGYHGSKKTSCINKNKRDRKYEKVANVGGKYNGVNWKRTGNDAIKEIWSGEASFYMPVGGHDQN